jgi:hypothetical protein
MGNYARAKTKEKKGETERVSTHTHTHTHTKTHTQEIKTLNHSNLYSLNKIRAQALHSVIPC